ncbi:hypothetical protein FACS1894198_4100 [Clostridia bacterium]|nr:hypothetical protein FACS1894198_4100 [Clostridia bacterium]
MKNNILTITTGFYWRRKEIIYRLENIEDAKFCYETGRYRGQSSKHTCGGLYIKTTGEVAYKVYSVSQHLRIVEVETLIYLIHMIKQNEPDILVEINMEYITALREEYILSTEDAAKIDPRRIDEEIKREELKRRREEKKKRNTKGNKIK